MAEGTQVRGIRFDRMAAVDRTIEAVHDEAKPPRAGSCSLPRRSSSLKTLVCTPLARSKIIFRTSELGSGSLAELETRVRTGTGCSLTL